MSCPARPWASMLLAVSAVVAQQPQGVEGLAARISPIFEDMNRQDRPGGGVVVVKDGQVVVQKAYGLASIEHNVATTPKTVFDLGSMAEPFTAAAVALLAGQGKLSMDDSVRKHLPNLPPWMDQVTVRHLVEHRSGLRDWAVPMRMAGWSGTDVLNTAQVLAVISKQTQPLVAPGTKFVASPSDYVLLGEVVRAASGQSLRDFVWKELFRPLKMNRTFVRDNPREIVDNGASYYNFHGRDGYLKGAEGMGVAGSHALCSTLEDLGKWAVALDQGALPLAKTLLSAPAEAETWHGMRVERNRGLLKLASYGTWNGSRGAIQIYPEQRLFVAVLVNWDYNVHHPTQLASQVCQVLLASAFKADAAPASATPKAPDRAWMEKLAGDYRYAPGYVLTLTPVGDNLELLAQGERDVMVPVGARKWLHPRYGIRVQFPDEAVPTSCKFSFGGAEERTCPKIQRGVPTQADMEGLVGRYVCGENGVGLEVALKGKALVARHPRLGEFPLQPESRDVYYGHGAAFPVMRFSRSEAGVSFVLDQEDAASFVFRRQ